MARPGRFDHLKPEILRLLAEGVSQAEIRGQYPDIPKATLSQWANSEVILNQLEQGSKPPQLRLPIDPETPLEKIRAALWDIVYNPEGKGAAVQALNLLIKIEAPWLASGASEPHEADKATAEIKVTRRIVDASNP